ncbi:GPI ethanolamine phosphate transferase 3 [Anthonomus grandis grandis]|uniref:GPI ethanolamine phosphate transferase 3 n=1 Tax=Anthonomus grandis grandis TaxID=2921223 RepID=UPI0021655E86|nr:GPI ethanolamine phosphate transferase 3 [Anthonomus grandis grandis]
MKRKLKYFLTLLWFTYLIISSILLFKKGFLLTREVQTDFSNCSITLDVPYDGLQSKYDEAHNVCMKMKTKVILLIVDALRYDFTVFNDNMNTKEAMPFENKLPIIKDILAEKPEHTRLYKFIADPPTTTMQRLKALTTGSLPTFIDAGSNFASSEITEDNLIDQLVKNGKTAVFMGDDTWVSLYPNKFLRNHSYPSFDVWDLDTVDDGVRAKLFPELSNTDWDLLIGHFLGVDHCGHRYGPNHPEMARKLGEINEAIRQVIETMDDNSILFVIGDHGMTVTGDHGGESLDEIEAAMFVHSKRPLQTLSRKTSVKQVDLVPTLAAILGIPIPFQNLGILIRDVLPIGLNQSNAWQMPLFSLWGNLLQVVRYIRTYEANTHTFDDKYLDLYYEEVEELSGALKGVDNVEKYVKFAERCEQFMQKIRLLCEEVWIQFDPLLISNGLTFTFLSIFFMFIISDGIPLKHLPYAIEGSFVTVSVIGLCFSIILVATLGFSRIVQDVWYSSVFITNTISNVLFLLPIFQNWGVISISWHLRSQSYDIVNLICRFILIFSISGTFSNSFINEDASVTLFLLVGVLMLTLLTLGTYLKTDLNFKQKIDFLQGKTFMKLLLGAFFVLAVLRATMFFWRCRVEQTWCFDSSHELFNTIKLKSESSKLQWCFSVIALTAMTILVKTWLQKCGNLTSFSLTEFTTKLIPKVMVVCIAGYWVLQRLVKSNTAVTRTSNYLALSVYILAIISIIILLAKPVCVCIIFNNREFSAFASDSIISDIFNQIKRNLNRQGDGGSVPVICGLGTSYSTVYVILGTYVTLLLGLVLGDVFAFSIVGMVAVATFFLFVTSVLRIKRAETVDDLLNVPTVTILGWALISQYFFYATGHQPAFSNIAWESAFVGTSGLTSNQIILGTLVLLNTFGSFIWTGLLLPLLVIAPFTVLTMAPSVCGKQKEFYAEVQKGELILYERDRLTLCGLFAVSCKYIAGHTLRVFACMLAATIHCRHLMVWNVFAPKFIFEALALFFTILSVLVGYLIFTRVNFQVDKLITKLNKLG